MLRYSTIQGISWLLTLIQQPLTLRALMAIDFLYLMECCSFELCCGATTLFAKVALSADCRYDFETEEMSAGMASLSAILANDSQCSSLLTLRKYAVPDSRHVAHFTFLHE